MPGNEPMPKPPPDKTLSSPSSTGSAGPRFEVQVVSACAVLMLAGGVAPCLDCGPINKITLQERKSGYRIDDFVVYAGVPTDTGNRRLLVQVKLGIKFTKADDDFRDTIIAAWRDFNDPSVFAPSRDAIAIVTGPLSATELDGVRTVLDLARTRASAADFFTDAERNNLYSAAVRDKLAAIHHHINTAAGIPPSDDHVFQFLRHLHVLGFDLDVRSGTSHALLRTIIGCFQTSNPVGIWARVLEEVAAFNPMAGTLTVENFADDIRAAFRPRVIETIPASLASTIPPTEKVDWNGSKYAAALVIANLLGGWNERSDADLKIIAALAPVTPTEWMRTMREVLHLPDSPLTHRDGVWTVKQRVNLWTSLASRLFGGTLETFRACSKAVLGEVDPKFELDEDKRFAAAIYGKVPAHSWAMRNGMAETLALLGSNTAELPNCGLAAGEATATVVVRELLEPADWQLWGSLDRLLPTLAEASPTAFLSAVEACFKKGPSPFDALFAQEGNGLSGGTYISGLLWALETLAWDESTLVRVSVILAMLAARDPGGSWGNRPANSLSTIFLPWFPQTRAPIEKRIVAVRAVVSERREVGWRLLKRLLPSHHSVSSGTNKPKWRNKLGDDDVPRPTTAEYWEQVTAYAKTAVDIARADSDKLADLIDSLDTLPGDAFSDVLAHLESEAVVALPDEKRLPLWTKLTALARKHRAYADAKWALPPDAVDKIEHAAATIAPKDPFVAHRVLFVENTWDLHDEPDDWQKSEELLAERQRNAVKEIFERGGLDAVIAFAKTVESPWKVGYALGEVESINVAAAVLPQQIDPTAPLWKSLAHGFVNALWQRGRWGWFDSLDMSDWTTEQIAQVLIYLPFEPQTWKRVDQRLAPNAAEYWARLPVGGLIRGDRDYVAFDALMKVNRPRAAVACLAGLVLDKQPIDPVRAVYALLAAVGSNERGADRDPYHTATVIKALQDEPSTDKNKLIAVEWAYLAWLENSQVTTAKTLSASLAESPDSFCEIIRRIFRSNAEKKNEDRPPLTEERRAVAENAYRLLENWDTVPGTQPDGSLSADALCDWIDKVQTSLTESGHLDIGLQKVGEVFLHALADPSGLYIHHAVAEVLNREDMAELRRGYELAIYNSRGAHFVDPTGAPERELAANYKEKADAVENAGYHRLAITLRSISDGYLREAEQNIARLRSEREMPD
jgi:hypothetical protein